MEYNQQHFDVNKVENTLAGIYGQICSAYNKKRIKNRNAILSSLNSFKKKIDEFRTINHELTDEVLEKIYIKAKDKWDKIPPVDWNVSTSKLNNYSWNKAKYKARLVCGEYCLSCGSESKISVDHIKPKSKYPELKYDIRNLQVLCVKCNGNKGNHSEVDFRTDTQRIRALTLYYFPDSIHDMKR